MKCNSFLLFFFPLCSFFFFHPRPRGKGNIPRGREGENGRRKKGQKKNKAEEKGEEDKERKRPASI